VKQVVPTCFVPTVADDAAPT